MSQSIEIPIIPIMTIMNFQNIFNTDDNLYNWMKIQYMDVCSNGDVIINKILDKLNNKDHYLEVNMEEIKYITHIIDTYNDCYLKKQIANPYWAS